MMMMMMMMMMSSRVTWAACRWS
ncbi:hypothetical protein EYF80_068395 [Liparis tanakae]|uniref:Uncharacterized protein n=1 Tax=Liparis tanakae TaxID=230148 RepID=A0A4Z2DY47_9TELE|nr:hypothetical protein EYF80_068395 [Liparis tanakae]